MASRTSGCSAATSRTSLGTSIVRARTSPTWPAEVVEETLKAATLDAEQIEVIHVGNAFGELFTGQGHLGAMPATVHAGLWGRPRQPARGRLRLWQHRRARRHGRPRAGNYDAALVLGLELEKTVSGDQAARHLGAAAWIGHEGQDATFMWPYMFDKILDESPPIRRRPGSPDQDRRGQPGNARRNPNAQTRAGPSPISGRAATRKRTRRSRAGSRRFDCSQVTDGGALRGAGLRRVPRPQPGAPSRSRGSQAWGHRTVGIGLARKLERSARTSRTCCRTYGRPVHDAFGLRAPSPSTTSTRSRPTTASPPASTWRSTTSG